LRGHRTGLSLESRSFLSTSIFSLVKKTKLGHYPIMNVLVIDIGGTNVKILATGQQEPVKFP
jgi:hypothetical protein